MSLWTLVEPILSWDHGEQLPPSQLVVTGPLNGSGS